MLVSSVTLARYWLVILSSAFALLFFFLLLSLSFGAASVSLSEVIMSLLGKADNTTSMIVNQLRLPRALLAILVGAVLACSGAMTQGLFRNPLADPSLIGVGAGASVGAGLVIVFLSHLHAGLFGLSLISFGAFVGGMIAVAFVYHIATGPGGTSVATMLLAGIAVTFFAGSISSVLEFIADNEMLRRISLWRMGGLDAANYSRVLVASLVAAAIFSILPLYATALNALLLGESEARHLGIEVDHVKKIIVICVAAGVGSSVALAGSISFIGLVVPHMVRIVCGPNHRFLLPLSAFFGAILLLTADVFARVVLAPSELPVGLVTAFIGAPFFIFLLRNRHRYGMQS